MEILELIVEQVAVTDPDECWPWTGWIRKGYGLAKIEGVRHPVNAHRLVYEVLVDGIPAGHDLDHLCHNWDPECPGGVACRHRRCVNPDHLEPVTHAENVSRGRGLAAVNARKTHCDHGHEFTPENTYVGKTHNGNPTRVCRACNLANVMAYRARKR